jgi:hypothetical protein
VDRVERHDVLNAIGLAVVLLAMALGLVFGARALFRTVNGGLVDKEQSEQPETTDPDAAPPAAEETTNTTEEVTTTSAQVHLPSEVVVRVGNGARRGGVASAGTNLVEQAGYPTLSPKNAPSAEVSVIYYVEGFQADAVQVARLLNLGETQIAPMPADPGIPQGEALLVVILGTDTTVGR